MPLTIYSLTSRDRIGIVGKNRSPQQDIGYEKGKRHVVVVFQTSTVG
jgi:hypothetical protein